MVHAIRVHSRIANEVLCSCSCTSLTDRLRLVFLRERTHQQLCWFVEGLPCADLRTLDTMCRDLRNCSLPPIYGFFHIPKEVCFCCQHRLYLNSDRHGFLPLCVPHQC